MLLPEMDKHPTKAAILQSTTPLLQCHASTSSPNPTMLVEHQPEIPE